MTQHNFTISTISRKPLKVMMTTLIFAMLSLTQVQAQNKSTNKTNRGSEAYGRTLNLGVGIGYYGYLSRSAPFLTLNYEFDVARQFALAPFIGIMAYRSNAYGNRYYYRENIIPIGVKGTYYFDRILEAGSDWDFYLAGSLGFVTVTRTWDDGYNGDRDIDRRASPLYLDLHIGAEYHISRRAGLFLDLSTGVSTFGLAIHGK